MATSGLAKRYGRATAVEDVDLRVPAGSIYALLGPNGAGKTTILRMLLGLTRPTAGEVTLMGRDALRDPRARRSVGGMIETPALYANLTGLENLRVYAPALGADRARMDEVLEIVGLDGAAHRRAGAYSLGMRQRLGVALALLGDPELLILDEPQNGLDPGGMRDMRALLRDLRERGYTLLVSSHLLAEVEQVATHVGLIDGGRLAFEGPLGELQARTRPRLRLEVSEPERALALLEPWLDGAAPEREGRRLVLSGVDDVPAVARALVGAGLELHRLEPLRPSLEDTFFHLTRDAGPDPRRASS